MSHTATWPRLSALDDEHRVETVEEKERELILELSLPCLMVRD